MLDIGGRSFRIRPVFPSNAVFTHMAKLLTLIDTELKKDTRTA